MLAIKPYKIKGHLFAEGPDKLLIGAVPGIRWTALRPLQFGFGSDLFGVFPSTARKHDKSELLKDRSGFYVDRWSDFHGYVGFVRELRSVSSWQSSLTV